MNRSGTTLWVLAAIAATVLAMTTAGCAKRTETVTPKVEPPVVATTTAETTATVLTTATPDTTSPPPPPPADTTVKSGPILGPNETGKHFAYLKKMYKKGGYVYAVVDYILIGEGGDGWFITNDNPKLRTFPLAKTCLCRYLVEGGASLSTAMTPSAFMTKWVGSPAKRMIRRNPYELTVGKGMITKLDNEWLP